MVPSQDGYIKFGGLEDVFIETISTWISAQGSLGASGVDGSGQFMPRDHLQMVPSANFQPPVVGWCSANQGHFLCPDPKMSRFQASNFLVIYPLVKVYIHNKLENHHFIAGKIHETSTGPWLQVRKLWVFTRWYPGVYLCWIHLRWGEYTFLRLDLLLLALWRGETPMEKRKGTPEKNQQLVVTEMINEQFANWYRWPTYSWFTH